MKQRSLAPTLVLWLFPVIVVGLIVGLVYGAIALADIVADGARSGLFVRRIAGPLVVLVIYSAYRTFRHKPEQTDGVEVTKSEHPQLWAEVTELAELAQTAPPDRIVVAPEVNAFVREFAGKREMMIGLPLLATMKRGELRAVIAHELGHFAGGDTASAARAMRRIVFLEQIRERANVMWRWFFTGYVRLYEIAAGPASRAAELRADQLSIAAAGPRTAAESHRTLVRTDVSWSILSQNYVSLFSLAGLRAPMWEGLRRIFAANAESLDAAAAQIIAEERPSPRDTHPPTRERIAAFEAAAPADTALEVDVDPPASDLLTGGSEWLSAAEAEMLVQPFPLASWDEVITRGVREEVNADAEQTSARGRQLGHGTGSLDDLLTLIDEPEEGSTAESLASVLAAPVISAMLDVGAAQVVPSWTGGAYVAAPDGSDLDYADRLLAAAESQDSSGLRAWLAGLGVDVARARARTHEPIWLAAASHLKGPWKGRRDVHVWTNGLLALPLERETIKTNQEQFSDKHQHPRLLSARAQGVDAGRRTEDALWWDASQITAATLSGKLRIHLLISLADGESHEIVSTTETVTFESAESFGDAIRFVAAPSVEGADSTSLPGEVT